MRTWRYWIAAIISAPFRWYYQYTIIGEKNIPKGGCVLCFNHPGRADGWLTYIHLNREIVFLAKIELFRSLYRYPLSWFNQIPIDRDRGRSTPAIKKAVSLVKKGFAFGIFSEGTCVGAPKLRYFYTGGARVALEAGVPIIPVAIHGSYGMLPDDLKLTYQLPKKQPVRVLIGKPLYFKQWYGKQDDRTVTREVMEHVRTAVRDMLIKDGAPKAYWGPVTAKKPKIKPK